MLAEMLVRAGLMDLALYDEELIDAGNVCRHVATLVDVRADFWWAWDADGSVWLLPAYTFTDTEERTHTVPAVTDEYLVVQDVAPTEPSVVEPPASVPPATGSNGTEPGVAPAPTDVPGEPVTPMTWA